MHVEGRTAHVLEQSRDRFAWCFSHGHHHRFAMGEEPWCTATWVWLEGSTEPEALTMKEQVYAEARFLDELPDYQQLGIINGQITERKTEVDQ